MASDGSLFEILPLEILSNIFANLPLVDKRSARLVCQRWHALLDDCKYLRLIFCPKVRNDCISHFYNTTHKIEFLLMENVTLRMNDCGKDPFPFTKAAELGWNNSESHIVKFFRKGCKNLESLRISKFAFGKIRQGVLSGILREAKPQSQWDHLRRLDITVAIVGYKPYCKNHTGNVIVFFKRAQIPVLMELNAIFEFKGSQQERRTEKLFLGFYEFLAQHSKSLKTLQINVDTPNDMEIGIGIPGIPDNIQVIFLSDLKIRSYSLRFCGSQRVRPLISSELLGCQLMTLELKHEAFGTGFHMSSDLGIRIQGIFQENRNSLKNVYLDIQDIQLCWFEGCTYLESIEIDGLGSLANIQEQQRMKLEMSYLTTFRFLGKKVLRKGFRKLLEKNAQTLERIDLFTTRTSDPLQAHFDLHPNNYPALKSLYIRHIEVQYMQENIDAEFLHLREFKFLYHVWIDSQLRKFICKTMPNLECITILGTPKVVFVLSLIAELPKLKQIEFCKAYYNVPGDLEKFCQFVPGVRLTMVKSAGLDPLQPPPAAYASYWNHVKICINRQILRKMNFRIVYN